MKYRYKMTFHMIGGEVLVSETESEEKTDKEKMELAINLTMKKDYVIEDTRDGLSIRGINMRNVLYIDIDCEEVL